MFIFEALSFNPLAEHKFLRAIDEHHNDLRLVQCLLANTRNVTAAEPSWSMGLIERASNPAFQSQLARQLNDELGRGDPDRRHLVRVDRILSNIEAHVGPISDPDQELQPGRQWQKNVEPCFCDPSFHACVGALLASKYRSEELGVWLDTVLQQHCDSDTYIHRWLVEHADIEAGHAAACESLLVLISSEAERREAIRGALAFDGCIWKFLSDVQIHQHDDIGA